MIAALLVGILFGFAVVMVSFLISAVILKLSRKRIYYPAGGRRQEEQPPCETAGP